jgi:hypothetical protein
MTKYIEYVMEMIDKFKKHSKLIENDRITPYLLNKALGEYQDVNLALIGEYQRAKVELKKCQDAYNEWNDEKFMTVRKEMFAEFEGKTVKVSVKEIETGLRVKYRDDYNAYQQNISDAEMKVSFLRRLVEQWKRFDSVLTTLSYNMQSELRALSIVERFNTPVRRTKIAD